MSGERHRVPGVADPATYRPRTGEIPESPGVYKFRDAQRRVIYVGKAKSLRQRLTSYFADLAGLHPRTQTMVTTAASVEWTVVGTEVEALQLEYSWIKEYDPRFNVKYRDDKSYPFLAVTMGEEYPRVQVMRGAKRKGTRYFGPYAHAWAIRETVDLLLRVFPVRTCSNGVFKRAGQVGRPCLLGYIDKCSAPCVGRIDAEAHKQLAEDFCDFMAGQTQRFVRRIEQQMRAAASEMEYERAARLRDDLAALRRALEKNAVVLPDGTDADVFALAEDDLEAAVQVFHVRDGRIRGQRGWVVEKVEDVTTGDLVEQLLLQVYGDAGRDGIPREVLVPADPPDLPEIEALLTEVRGARVAVRVPQRGDKRALLETVGKNAGQALDAAQDAPRGRPHDAVQGPAGDPGRARPSRGTPADRVLRRLQHPGPARRRLDGGLRGRAAAQERVPPLHASAAPTGRTTWPPSTRSSPAGSAATSRTARTSRSSTSAARRTTATPVTTTAATRPGPPGSIRRPGGPAGSPTRRTSSSSTAGRPRSPRPPAALAELGIDDVALCGLAKRLEEVWLPDDDHPVVLPRTSEGLYLLQRVRDEAHRFAITHHRQRRSKAMTTSVLDEVPGLGPARQKALLRAFGSVKRLRAASAEEIASVQGIGPALAQAVVGALATQTPEPAVDTATGEIIE